MPEGGKNTFSGRSLLADEGRADGGILANHPDFHNAKPRAEPVFAFPAIVIFVTQTADYPLRPIRKSQQNKTLLSSVLPKTTCKAW